MNKLFYGDNIEILRKSIADSSVDLCYIDPPFNSKKQYFQIYNNIGKADKAQVQAFIDTWTWDKNAVDGFDEILLNDSKLYPFEIVQLIGGLEKVLGRGDLLAYLVSMCLRIAEIHRVLKPTGSFFLHCDPTASHYLKLILDAFFCTQGGDFRNEIIWCYTGPGSPGMRQFMRKHDVIFWYSKGTEWTFNRDDVRMAHSLKTKGNYKEGLVGSGFIEADHKIHEKGKVPEDWWEFAIAPRSKSEYLGYPTQKPEKLLDRIIRAASNEGDVVLDAYCGCGTSIAVAQGLKRNWIGIDITFQSISLILYRLALKYGESVVNSIIQTGIPQDFDSAKALATKRDDRVRKEFEKWAILTFSNNKAYIHEKKGGDRGIDGKAIWIDYNIKGDTEFKDILFSVKSDKTITQAHLREFNGVIEREKAAIGYFICLYKPNANIYRELSNFGMYENRAYGNKFPVIQIVTVEEILNKKRIDVPISQQLEVLRKAVVSDQNSQLDIF